MQALPDRLSQRMRTTPLPHLLAALLLLPMLLVLGQQSALAQARYPDKPIRIINPFPPGSPVEFVGRLAAERLTHAWGKPVLLIQGDTHQFVTDRPFAKTHPAASNVLRMVVPGEHVADAVVIDVDTMNVAEPFSIQRLHR